MLNFDSNSPIFIQISEYIKDCILIEIYKEDTQIPSTTDFSTEYKINPATARKGFTILVEEGILYKQRGIGMFVKEGARKKILEERQKNFFKEKVKNIMIEANKLGIDHEKIIQYIREGDFNE